MAINSNLLGLAIIGGSVAVLCGYMAHVSVDVETYPDVELAARVGASPSMAMNSTDHLHPGGHNVPTISTPHRYPNTTGSNISALIHRGMSPLSKRAPHDSKWIECPPSNVMW